MAQKIWKKSELSFLYQRSSFTLVDITYLDMLFILVAITDVRFWTYLAVPIYNNSDWNFCPSVFFQVAKLLWQLEHSYASKLLVYSSMFPKTCESLVRHQIMSTQARQVQGVRKTEIKDIKAVILWLVKNFLGPYQMWIIW